MPDRLNPTDREQDVLEQAEFEGGIPVRMNGLTRVVPVQNRGGASKTNNAGTNIQSNAGVVIPHDDNTGVFKEELIGKA